MKVKDLLEVRIDSDINIFQNRKELFDGKQADINADLLECEIKSLNCSEDWEKTITVVLK